MNMPPIKENTKGFFNQPWQISFKDILAIAFSSTFLFVCVLACFGKDNALAVLQALVPVIGIVLGGYFLQEGAAMYFMRSQGMNNNYGGYGGYGYNNYSYGTQSTPSVDTSQTVNTVTPEPTDLSGGDAGI